MKNFIVLLLLWAVLPGPTKAQENYRHGYIVLLTGDTVNLMINDLGDIANARKVEVKLLPELLEKKSFSPEMLLSYRILPSRQYVSGQWRGKYIFFRALVTGSLDLLVYRDENLKENVFIRNGNHLVHLYTLDKLYLAGRINNYKEMAMLHLEVNSRLDSIFRNCDKVRKSIACSDFKLMAIARMVRDYNECKGVNVFVDPGLYSNQPKVLLTAYAGLLSSAVVISDHGKAYFQQSEFRNRLGLTAGVAVDLNYRSWNPGLSLRFDAGYRQRGMQTVEGNVYNKVISLPPVPLQLKFRLDYLDLALLMKYRWTDKQLSPWLAGGLMAGHLVNSTDEAFVAVENGEKAGYIFSSDNMSPAEAGFVLQVGLTWQFTKKSAISAALSYENSSLVGLSESTFKNRSAAFSLGFSF